MYIYIYIINITWFLGFYVQIRNKTSRVSNIRWGLCPTAWRNMRPLPWRNGIRSVTRSLVSRSRVCVRRPWKLEWSPRGHKVAWQVGMGCWNPKRWPRRWWRPWLWRSFWSCRILRCWPISSGRPQIMSAGWKEWANSRRISGIWSGGAHQPLPQSCEASCLAPFLRLFGRKKLECSSLEGHVPVDILLTMGESILVGEGTVTSSMLSASVNWYTHLLLHKSFSPYPPPPLIIALANHYLPAEIIFWVKDFPAMLVSYQTNNLKLW